jgi:hypothetical protein
MYKFLVRNKQTLFQYLVKYMLHITYKIDLKDIWFYHDIPTKFLIDLEGSYDMLVKINNNYYAVLCIFRQDTYTKIMLDEVKEFFETFKNPKIKGGFLISNAFFLDGPIIASGKIGTINEYSHDKVDKGVVHIINGLPFDKLPDEFFKEMHKIINKNKI